VDAEANIIFGAAFDPALDGKIRVSVVATGMDNAARAAIETPSRKASASVAMPATLASPPVDAVEPAFEAAPSLPLAPQPVVRPPSAPAEPAIISPGRVAALAPAPEPVAAPPLRIVDPAVEQESDELYPPLAQRTPRLHPRAEYRSNPATAVEHRRPPPKNPLPDPRTPPEKKGWLTLFGGGRAREELSQPQHRMEAPQRYQDPAPSELPRGVDAEPVVDDLDIPSFLRRLAN
jgi:cell division protein FtsZ